MSNTKTPSKPSFADFCIQQPQEDYFIELFPANKNWVSFLSEQEGGKEAAQKLYDAMTSKEEEEELKWGLSIPKKRGIRAVERIAINSQSESRSNAALNFNQLILLVAQEQEAQAVEKKIKKEEEFSVEQIAEFLQKAIASGVQDLTPKQMGLVSPHLKKIQEIADEFNSLSETIPQVTHLLRTRVISSWTEEDTKILHEHMFSQLLSIFREEQNYRTPERENPTSTSTP